MGHCPKKDCKYQHKSSTMMNTNIENKTREQEENHENRSNQECRYYNRGICTKGNRCNFIHKQDKEKKGLKIQKQCIYFQKGICKWGENCYYLHETQKTKESHQTKENEQICKSFLRGKCLNVNFCNKRHPNKIDRCSDFDQGFCPRGFSCQKTHMPDRVQPTSTTHPNLESLSKRDVEKDRSLIQGANRETNSLTGNVKERCKRFDEGYCPNWRNCKLTHAKDRIFIERHTTSTTGMQTRRTSNTNQL